MISNGHSPKGEMDTHWMQSPILKSRSQTLSMVHAQSHMRVLYQGPGN